LLRAGARAILPRDASRADIDAASAVVALGYTVITGGFTGTAPGDQAETLTPRERDVLAMLARGLANKRIAERLELSEHTVKFHVASILAKFGASTRTEAVTIGVRRGLVML
jgi:NarL family two-component system response regulator YdfI